MQSHPEGLRTEWHVAGGVRNASTAAETPSPKFQELHADSREQNRSGACLRLVKSQGGEVWHLRRD